jgi:CTP synthase (UTP-ammonia lyase)
MGIRDAEHEESAPGAPTLLISRLASSLVGTTQTIRIQPDSVAHRAYGREKVNEKFACNYGFNPAFRGRFEKGPLRITGVDREGEVRVVEIAEHPFYVATLYLPQISSGPGSPHPLIVAFLKAALAFQTIRLEQQ